MTTAVAMPLQLHGSIATRSAERFDETWRRTCYVAHTTREVADWMIRRHYIGKWPGVVTCVLGMFDGYMPVGVVVFALPPRETATRYGCATWELARLWIDDALPRNSESWLIGQSIRHIRHCHPEIHMLVSYADPSAGHAGTIYRASNWDYDGMTDAGRKSPRCDYSDGQRMYSRRSHVPEGATVTRIPRVSKHRYTYRIAEASR